jgi:GH24 family phage-related lysozyme (muramidase)
MAGYSVTYSVVDNASKQIEAINKRIQSLRQPLDRMARQTQQFVNQSGLKHVADGFGSIAKSAGSAGASILRALPGWQTLIGAASIGGMVKLASSTAEWAKQLGIAADQLGLPTDKLQELEGAAGLAGIGVDKLIAGAKGLQQGLADAFTGRNTEAAVYLDKLGVAARNTDGSMRKWTDALPELLTKLDQIKDPTDRARAAIAIGGQALNDLSDEVRESGKSVEEWVATYRSKFPPMSKEQLDALRQWRTSLNETSTTFEHLGNTIGATIAEDFNPLIQSFNDFVRKHEPEMNDKVKELTTSFREWGEQGGFAEITEFLKQLDYWGNKVAGTLNSINEAAKAAGKATHDAFSWFFHLPGRAGDALRQGLGIDWQAPAQAPEPPAGTAPYGVHPAEPPAGAPAPAGVQPPAAAPGPMRPTGEFFAPYGGQAAPPLPQSAAPAMRPTPASYTPPTAAPTAPAPPMGPAAAPATAAPATAAPATAAPAGAPGDHQFLRKQEGLVLHPYSDVGHQAIGYGHDFTEAEKRQGFASGASGAQIPIGKITKEQANDLFNADYQVREQQVSKRVPGWDGLNANQKEAVMSYYYNTGRLPRGLAENVQTGNTAGIASSLEHGIATVRGQPFAPLVKRRREEAALFNTPAAQAPAAQAPAAQAPAAQAPTAQGPPVQVEGAPGAPGASGNVNVTVTHRNPPPNTSTTARGSGDVTVAPVRVEQQELTAV